MRDEASYQDYVEIRDLDAARLRHLLVAGDPPERVWAAWALGLRFPGEAREPLARRADIDPHPGVRRRVLVMLAGFGRRDALQRAVHRDAHALVRATAAQYLTRVAERWDTAAATLLAGLLGRDPAPEVRAAVAREVRPDAPDELARALTQALDDASADVRSAAVEASARHDRDGALPPALRRRLAREPDVVVRRRILEQWADHEGPDAMLRGVGAGSDTIAVEALEEALRRGARPSWRDVEALAQRPSAQVGLRVAQLFAGRLDTVPLSWLVDFVLRAAGSEPVSLSPPGWGGSDRLWRGFVDGVAGRLAGRSRESLDPKERQAAAQLREVAEAWARAASEGPRRAHER